MLPPFPFKNKLKQEVTDWGKICFLRHLKEKSEMAPDEARHLPQWEVGLQTVWLNPAKQGHKKSKGTLHSKINAVNSATFLSACTETSADVRFDHSGKNYHQGAIVKGSLTAYGRKLEKEK